MTKPMTCSPCKLQQHTLIFLSLIDCVSLIRSLEAQQQCRYAASWILFTAYIPIVILYCVWLPLTYMGQIRPPSSSSDRDSSSSSCHSAVVSVQHITKNEMHGHDGQQQQATIDSEQQIEMRTSSDLNSATDHDNES